jgi:hypothetical protein
MVAPGTTVEPEKECEVGIRTAMERHFDVKRRPEHVPLVSAPFIDVEI